MNCARAHQVTPIPLQPKDPAGADRVVLAAAEAVTHWAESLIFRYAGVPLDLWNGNNGLRGVVEEAVEVAGIPNKRFGEIVNPRTVAQQLNIVPMPKRRHRSKA